MSAIDFDDPTPAVPGTAAMRRATESEHRFDEFVAILAHELRNPLAPICTAVDLLRVKGSPDPDVVAAHDVIERQVKQMTRLMDDLLDVSRITRGKLALQKKRTQLAPIVADAVDSSRPLIDEKSQRLTVVLPPEPLLVEADPVRLIQVLVNLLNNAAKFTSAGGSIRLETARQGSDVVISVRDTGIGIPGPMLPHVFELFTQVDRSPGRRGSGLGVGLALVKRLVELHGGRVELHSDGIGRGSEVAVRLPLLAAPAVAAPVQRDGSASKPMAKPCRVLVVDDIKDLADSLALLLRRMGHDVRIAYNGRAAIEASEMLQPELALLDIGLPEMSGYEIAQKIRKQAWGRSVYLVALTGWGQPEDKTRALELGFNRHMTKPVSFAELEQLVAEAAKWTAAAANRPKLPRTPS